MRMSNNTTWPAVPGSYEVGDTQGPVAICTLTTESLIEPLAHLPGVAITGKVYTANLGITRIVVNVTANPAIRFLLLCGKDSPVFHPGQSLVALADHGVDAQRQIIGAIGYDPVLRTLAPERVALFRRQVEVIDWSGEDDIPVLQQRIGELAARNPGRFVGGDQSIEAASAGEQSVTIRPGGVRELLQYDPNGYFVITLDREREQIALRHYLPNHTPAHEMWGHAAGPMLLGLLREGLVTQLSHAGYLGEELAKAEIALRLGLRYDQDRPVRPLAPIAAVTLQQPSAQDSSMPAAPPMPAVQPPTTWAEFESAALDAEVSVAFTVTGLPTDTALEGMFLEADEADPFSTFRRTSHRIQVSRTTETTIVMGGTEDVGVGALLRVRGTLGDGRVIGARGLVILTHVARIID